ncbi:MAG: hypothetical protein H6741_21105 [Alphaproteobacteria bacterium]|nr:hypothetical protein [Alphaproteobacteria bacterium]
MPAIDLGALLSLLGHPISIALLSLLVATATSMLVGAQLRAVGLDANRSGGRLAWSTVFAVACFWGTLLLGLSLAAARAELPQLPGQLRDAFNTLLALVPAGLVLAGASHFRAQYLRDASDRRDLDEGAARDRADLGLAVAGVLAALGLMGQGFGAFLMALAVGAGGYWLLRTPDAQAKLSQGYEDFSAGLRLRERRLNDGDTVEGEGRRLRLLGPVGLLSTWVREDEVDRAVGNRELLGLLSSAKQLTDKSGS